MGQGQNLGSKYSIWRGWGCLPLKGQGRWRQASVRDTICHAAGQSRCLSHVLTLPGSHAVASRLAREELLEPGERGGLVRMGSWFRGRTKKEHSTLKPEGDSNNTDSRVSQLEKDSGVSAH